MYTAVVRTSPGVNVTANPHGIVTMAHGEDIRRRPSKGKELFFSSFGGEDCGCADVSHVRPGWKIERYEVLDILGEGGYGIVYLAEQREPVRRRVALKVIKPGMDSKQILARFEAERQALALLDHPNIAHIFDAGTTDAGRPYFVMEYIEGLAVTEHCDACKSKIEDRLKVFLQVCRAVQHAHHKGIIHRDIKPTNILVSMRDGRPLVKIIDFGVARAVSEPLTDRTLNTLQGQVLGTPEYMSPEQADMASPDVDTRSDIYSLGAVLYELLTGTQPFDPQSLRKSGFDSMRRTISEQTPLRPSTRLLRLGESAKGIADKRCAEVGTLVKRLGRELDWIVMKTLEKDRARRYSTAQGLAEDIERHLNHQPVSAGSPPVLYRSRKFVRRHRAQVLLGGFIFALVILSAAIIGQYRQSLESHRSVQKEFAARQEALALENARNTLSTAQANYASGRYAEALKALNLLVDNKHVGSQARLLRARMALDQPDVDVPIIDELQELLNEPNDIASQAHLLLAKIYLESSADDDKTVGVLERRAAEHLQKAELLPSDSADACFARALLSDTPAERMELLNKALTINPGHIDCRRIRALSHYVSRDYDNMEIDASVITAVARDNPEGYALCAIALREKARLRGREELLSRAVAKHTRAVELAPTRARFYDERRETYMRLQEYEKALADARACIRLSPEESIYNFHAFCALTALGRYAEAQREYEMIVISGGSSGGDYQFRRWAGVYALEIVGRHSQWHPADREPEGAAFAIIRQTVEAHRNLAKKARCIVREGADPAWSPNGDELAYSRGALGYSALEVLNLRTGATRLLCYSGLCPAWSPDGRWIAFARHRRTMRLQDLDDQTKTYEPARADMEVCIVKADGTGKPRILAKGGYPSWSQDSRRLYYHSPEEGGYLCSISIEDDNAKHARVMPALYIFPVVSPDEKYVVWHAECPDLAPAELVELSSGKVVYRWVGFFPNWSSDGRSIVFSQSDGQNDGVWVCDLDKGRAAKVLDDWICYRCSWESNTGRIALCAYAHTASPDDCVYSGMRGSIWIGSLDYSVFGAGLSALTRDWPGSESNARNLIQMIRGYRVAPHRTMHAEPLYHRLIELLEQAVVFGDPNSIGPVKRLADVYLWSGRYDDAEQLYLQARDQLLAKSGAASPSVLEITEQLIRFYLDVCSRDDKAEPLCVELLETRREAFGVDDPHTIRALILLARICERRKRYRQAEQIYLDVLNIQPRQDAQQVRTEAYASPLGRWLFAPLSYFTDETAFVLKLLQDRGGGMVNGNRWKICAHYLLATLYAKCPRTEIHNAAKAVEHGTLACELTEWAEPICLDVLATAYAEAGRFELAVQHQKEAILRLYAARMVMKKAFMDRLTMYENGMAESPKGLVARWEFEQSKDGMVLDTSGNDLHGRLVGDAKVYADPDRGNVLCLDGDGDWVDCGAARRLDITGEITISAWVKVSKFERDGQTIISKGVGPAMWWGLQGASKNGTLKFNWGGERVPGIELYGDLHPHANVSDDKWHHVAGVYDGQVGRTYVNGELDTLSPFLAFTRIRASTGPVLIGNWAGLHGEWNGLIDDVRIYNRALTAVEIAQLCGDPE